MLLRGGSSAVDELVVLVPLLSLKVWLGSCQGLPSCEPVPALDFSTSLPKLAVLAPFELDELPWRSDPH